MSTKTKRQQKEHHIIEQGHIYFFYKPKVQRTSIASLDDVQRLELLLHREATFDKMGREKNEPLYRLIVMARKQMPELALHGKGTWAFVADTETDVEKMDAILAEKHYSTKTRGERTIGAARPIGEGKYFLVSDGTHTHLVYELEVPHQLGEVQEQFHIAQEGSYIISVKSPHFPNPPNAGLSEGRRATYEEQLDELFKNRRWVCCDPPDFLNTKNCEILLLAASENPELELGIKFRELINKRKSEKDVLKELHLEGKVHTEPLKEGTFE